MEDGRIEVAAETVTSVTTEKNFSRESGFWDRVVTAKIPLGIPLRPLPYPKKISHLDWIRRCIYVAYGPIPDDWTFLWPNPKSSKSLNQLMIPMVLANSRTKRIRQRLLGMKKRKEEKARPPSLYGPITEQEILMVARKHILRVARPAKLSVKDLPRKKIRIYARKKTPSKKMKWPRQDTQPDAAAMMKSKKVKLQHPSTAKTTSFCTRGGEACKKFITLFVLVRNSPHIWSIAA
ncbi:uncharacterized protein LOC112492408 [Ziziphus jujuba]|uniref:Uncharacterized protein LOC112492408 n=2 Tax=Ziziphus jujuba TaxID=326968 RepID=A0ABM3IQC3_ZIZJJ|nr:uncharacterized protein LOC112492408 [Ziziphus jujuba]KAH7521695.1 hypothetical protein FEM48_Zijuj07G0060100 [Ziziphus jujuba var. spinosa]